MPNQLPREEQIYIAALQLATREESAAYLKDACAGDAVLLQRVEALLQAHERARATLDPNATIKSPPSTDLPLVEPVTERSGDRIGRYKLLQEIGEGGCGVVYMAEQHEPVRRRVALKVIKLGMDSKQVIARFEAERQALALMDHSNIAKVFDAGATETGRPFFVMELVRGVPITEYCDKNNLTTRERLELFIPVCRAFQHAHQKGIIHRDIKPSNILVTLHDGVPVPKVIDFGIAKAIEQPLTEKTLFTRFEQFIGTPAYMSPEQAEMSGLDIDTRSDIYALGVLLYELLTGKPPFDPDTLVKSGLDAMRRTIREVEPPRPSTRLTTLTDADLTIVARQRRIEPAKLSALMRGDLDWIVMKAMEKDRTRRYDTANSLSMDIQRHLQNEPVTARPPSNLYRFQKLIRRKKLVFAAVSSVTAALIVGLGLSAWLFLKEREAHRNTQVAEREQDRMHQAAQQAQADEAELRRQAKAQELVARQKTYGSDMRLVQQALTLDNLGRARELLDSQRPRSGEEDLRGWEWRYLWQFCKGDEALLFCQRTNSVIASVSFSSDGALLAVGTRAGEVTVWDIAARQLVFRQQSADIPARLAFAPNTDMLAYCDQTSVVLWNSRTHREARRLQTGGSVRELVFTTDGRLFTACPGVTTLWDVESGRVVSNFVGPPAYRPLGTLFNATSDGRTFAHAAGLHGVRVVDTADGSNEWKFKATEETVAAIAFSRDGRLLATGPAHAVGTIKLWNVQSHQLVGSLEGHRNWICWLRFLPDGKTLASAGAEGTVRLWNLDTRQPLKTLSGHPGRASAIDVSPDGRWLVSGCWDGSVFLWDLASSTTRPPIYHTLPSVAVERWSYSPDNRLIGTLQSGHVKLYDAKTLQLAAEPDLLPTNLTTFTFSPDTRLLVAMATDGNLWVWDLPGQRVLTNFVAHPAHVGLFDPVFTSGGNRLLTWGGDTVAKEWDVETWREINRWQVAPDFNMSATCPATNLLAIASRNGLIELITPDDPEQRRRFNSQDLLRDIKLSIDGKTLATASENGTIELWNVETMERIGSLRATRIAMHSEAISPRSALYSVAISPDGRRVIAGNDGKRAITIWDVNSQQEVATLDGKGLIFSNAAFSPDGNTIGARNLNGVLHLWRAPTWAEIEAAERAGQ